MNKAAVLLSALILSMSLSSCQQTPAPVIDDSVSIVTSFYPLYDFALKVAGDKATVTNLTPAGTEPHNWEPSPADMVIIQNADIFVYNGAGMEHWVDSVLSSISSENIVVINTSDTLLLRPADEEHADASTEQETTEAEEDHAHGAYDPHVWLDPMNAKEQMRVIYEALIKVDQANASTYKENFDTYAKEFDVLDKEFSDALRDLPNRNIIVAHEAFGYLCDRYDLVQVPIEGLSADSEPDAARMAEIIDFVKEHDVRVIFFEELLSPKVAETIATETGAVTDTLNPIGGLTEKQLADGEDYFSIMRTNLAALTRALS